MRVALLYATFAAIASLVNLGAQYAWFSFDHSSAALYNGILIGTAIGLAIKFLLDKNYIFYYRSENSLTSLKKFILYSIMGVFTTGVFWTSELVFHTLWLSPYAKYIGGAIGLTLGYTLKYFLDKKFVFTKTTV